MLGILFLSGIIGLSFIFSSMKISREVSEIEEKEEINNLLKR